MNSDKGNEDKEIIKLFSPLAKLKAPEMTVERTLRRIKAESAEKPSITYRELIKYYRKIIFITAAITLLISVPVTYLLVSSKMKKPAEKIYIVKFIYESKNAENIAVVGDFNNWSKSDVLMQRIDSTGFWTAEIRLSEGIYKYMFLVDGKKWMPDPLSRIKVKDSLGNEGSLLVLLRTGGDEESL